jgi:hypothetical protein
MVRVRIALLFGEYAELSTPYVRCRTQLPPFLYYPRIRSYESRSAL